MNIEKQENESDKENEKGEESNNNPSTVKCGCDILMGAIDLHSQ